jgi:hypothetical protein
MRDQRRTGQRRDGAESDHTDTRRVHSVVEERATLESEVCACVRACVHTKVKKENGSVSDGFFPTQIVSTVHTPVSYPIGFVNVPAAIQKKLHHVLMVIAGGLVQQPTSLM